MPILKVENLSVSFKQYKAGFKQVHHQVISNLSITLNAGEILGITGPSGRGKTTFCRILSGFEQPVEGTVLFDGEPLRRKGYHPVQLIFQHPEKAVNPRWKKKKH